MSNLKMRKVATSQSMRRSYNRAIDNNDNNPFQSMYSQAYGGNVAVNHWAGQAMDTSNQKNYKQVSTKFDQRTKDKRAQSDSKKVSRKFGNYEASSQLNQSLHSKTIGGYSGGRATRCTDKFVRYPYPQSMNSGYQKDFKNKLKNTIVVKKGDAFNLEKEAKIINPHRMDLGTTSENTYKDFKLKPKSKQLKLIPQENKPIIEQSHYQKTYPNWMNGQQDIFHEKHPQYPFYSLPFKGESNYKQSFNEDQPRKLREHNEMLKSIGQGSSNVICLNTYSPLKFDSSTINQVSYKGFKLQQRPKVQTQAVKAVLSKAIPTHFDTFNKKEFIPHSLKKSALDAIPYP